MNTNKTVPVATFELVFSLKVSITGAASKEFSRAPSTKKKSKSAPIAPYKPTKRKRLERIPYPGH